jgi:hypothetical protein
LFKEGKNAQFGCDLDGMLFSTNFEILKTIRKYISLFLLLVFAWSSTPAHTIHDLFADHEVEEDFNCLVHHADLGVHFDEAHPDCDILHIDAPAFTESSEVKLDILPFQYSDLVFNNYNVFVSDFSYALLPSRAPPVMA